MDETQQYQLLGQSPIIKELHQKIELISRYNACVMISGETGTGKELVAREIHYLSPRCAKPFVPVDCGAIPSNLFENELFGHTKGAFTDAYTGQNGLVEVAAGGTLFLDEIDTLNLDTQVKLLRLLQDKEYRCIGDSKLRKVDIRIIAATNKPIMNLVKSGRFREDLFYRLNVLSLLIPPLRERVIDIPLLVAHFVKKYSAKCGKPIKKVSKETLRTMMSYPWPGNVRELENRIHRMIMMSDSTIIEYYNIELPTAKNQAMESALEQFNISKKKTIESFERAYLSRLLTECEGNVVKAAERAGKSRTGLWNLLKRHHLSPKKFRFNDYSNRYPNS